MLLVYKYNINTQSACKITQLHVLAMLQGICYQGDTVVASLFELYATCTAKDTLITPSKVLGNNSHN